LGCSNLCVVILLHRLVSIIHKTLFTVESSCAFFSAKYCFGSSACVSLCDFVQRTELRICFRCRNDPCLVLLSWS